jgi:toxin CcdB
MAQFDYYRNPNGGGYLLDVQADLLAALNSRVVVPLLPASAAPKPADRLNPIFEIEGDDFVLATQFMAAVPARELQQHVGSLAQARYDLQRAIDIVFSGV